MSNLKLSQAGISDRMYSIANGGKSIADLSFIVLVNDTVADRSIVP